MAQHSEVLLSSNSFTRSDYTALRAYCLKLPIDRIADLYYSEDSPQVAGGLERFLIGMRDTLIERAIEHNPHFAEILKGARQGGNVTSQALEILIKAADLPKPVPALDQPVAQWLKPKTTKCLREEGVKTLRELVLLIRRRGVTWWRSIPRVGAKRAAAIVKWINSHKQTLGEVASTASQLVRRNTPIELDPAKPILRPLGYFSLPSGLDGRDGRNRSKLYCYIDAEHDLEAVDCYLSKFSGESNTHRVYRKEIERLVLWAAVVRKKAVSSLGVEDCQAYIHFLASPSAQFRGTRAARTSLLWRPFGPDKLSLDSQLFASKLLRGLFDYLVKVRYLGGNPWVLTKLPRQEAVSPATTPAENEAWEMAANRLESDASRGDAQTRVALAALLMAKDSGLERRQIASACRSKLVRIENGAWLLGFAASGGKLLYSPVTDRTMSAIKAHWDDLGKNLLTDTDPHPILNPLSRPATKSTMAKLSAGAEGYSPGSVYDLIRAALKHGLAHPPPEPVENN